MLTFPNRKAHFVLQNIYCSFWPMKWHAAHFCTVLLTCCVAAWTDCWLCDSVQKYCCTVTGGGFANWFKSNCSQISSSLPPAHYYHHLHHHHHHHHHHHIFSWTTNCIAERQNICSLHYTIYTSVYLWLYLTIIISHSALPKIRNVSGKICLEIQNRHFVFSNFFFENRAIYEIMWNNMVEWGRPHMTIWRMHKAWWITKAINTHSEYVILIALPLQQYLNKSAKLFLYKHIACFAAISCK